MKDLDVEDGDVNIAARGKGLKVAEGSNCSSGIATLVDGIAVVANTRVRANTRIQLTPQVIGTILLPAALGVTTRTAGTSFTVKSADATDTSTFAYLFVDRPLGQ